MKCYLCPRNCGVDRDNGELGYCMAPGEMVVARYSLHQWEEPVISGEQGSGTIFFSYCNMRCCFCQNYRISELHKGRVVSIEEFSRICLDLQENEAHNINLVTPTMYVPYIIEGLRLAKKNGLVIPIVYNTSGYENVDTIRMLEGLVDIYLPDLKYYDDKLGEKYSNCLNYFQYASKAIEEMVRQVGEFQIDQDGMMKRGVIVRHLVMPGNIEDSKKIIKYLYERYGDKIILSIMNQYTPVRRLEYKELNRKVRREEYDEVINYAYDLGIRNAFIQEDDTQEESFIPDFDIFRAI
ncbi:MAG: radical SAM protein [Erysipelotrichaceae bacterium]|nr:radical SAM protein [Erysipelotrichaceae bacterium]